MIAAHTRMSDQLLAATTTVRPATPAFALISHHFEMLERLRYTGADFDSLYRDFQVRVHEEALASIGTMRRLET
jgi:predicted outer membrane protein